VAKADPQGRELQDARLLVGSAKAKTAARIALVTPRATKKP
jgi:hypothetical protein